MNPQSFLARLAFAIPYLAMAFMATLLQTALADDIELQNGVHINGKCKLEGSKYTIETSEGATIVLEKKNVKAVVATTDDKKKLYEEYESKVSRLKDTVDGHRSAAKWAWDKELKWIAQAHRERVLELDPDDKQARGELKYVKTDQGWVLADQMHRREGKVRDDAGKWKYPEEIADAREKAKALEEMQKADKFLERAIQDVIHQNPKRGADAMNYLKTFKDLATIPKIKKTLVGDKQVEPANYSSEIREMLIDALGRMQHPNAVSVLCEVAMKDPDHKRSEQAIEHLKVFGTRQAMRFFIDQIEIQHKASNPAGVDNAGKLLGMLGDKAAIYPLINHLVLGYSKEVPGGPDISNFSKDGGVGFSQGNGPKVLQYQVYQKGILDGLQELSGTSFQFNREEWMRWYAEFTNSKSDLELWRDP